MRQRSRDVPRSVTAAAPAGLAARSRAVAAHTSDAMAFLQGFLRHPAQVGSVIPSSPQLERRLVRATRVEQALSVVELGPGTGGTTRALLRAMRPDARLLAVELSAEFHARLTAQISDARLQLQLGSAEHLAEFLAARRLPAPEAILSGIPFSTMPPEVADRIARAIAQALAPGGRFVAYQVRAHVARYLTPYLGEPVKQWEWVNVPPVQVFTWTKRTRS